MGQNVSTSNLRTVENPTENEQTRAPVQRDDLNRGAAGFDMDYGYCEGPVFGGPMFGWYEPPMVVEETTVIHHPPPPQQQVIYVDRNQPPQNQKVQYVMIDPNDKGQWIGMLSSLDLRLSTGKRLITVDADRVQGANADFVVANENENRSAHPPQVASSQTSTVPSYTQQPIQYQQPQMQQQPTQYLPRNQKKKSSFCGCCVSHRPFWSSSSPSGFQ